MPVASWTSAPAEPASEAGEADGSEDVPDGDVPDGDVPDEGVPDEGVPEREASLESVPDEAGERCPPQPSRPSRRSAPRPWTPPRPPPRAPRSPASARRARTASSRRSPHRHRRTDRHPRSPRPERRGRQEPERPEPAASPERRARPGPPRPRGQPARRAPTEGWAPAVRAPSWARSRRAPPTGRARPRVPRPAAEGEPDASPLPRRVPRRVLRVPGGRGVVDGELTRHLGGIRVGRLVDGQVPSAADLVPIAVHFASWCGRAPLCRGGWGRPFPMCRSARLSPCATRITCSQSFFCRAPPTLIAIR